MSLFVPSLNGSTRSPSSRVALRQHLGVEVVVSSNSNVAEGSEVELDESVGKIHMANGGPECILFPPFSAPL